MEASIKRSWDELAETLKMLPPSWPPKLVFVTPPNELPAERTGPRGGGGWPVSRMKRDGDKDESCVSDNTY